MILTVYGDYWLTEQINWFFVKEVDCVFCEVVTEYLHMYVYV